MDISAAILHKILAEKNLEVFSKLKLSFLDPAYSSLYTYIGSFYEKQGAIPSFEDLHIILRDSRVAKTLGAVEGLELPDVSIDVIFDALMDSYTQNEAIKLLEPFIDKLMIYDASEIKNELARIALKVEESTYTTENVYGMNELDIFQKQETIANERVYLHINNEFDATTGGLARQEVMLLGGRRGSGKSLVSSNIFIEQYLMGNTSVYFSIEMTAYEIYQRHMAMLSGVPLYNIKTQKLTSQEAMKIVEARAAMFKDSEKVLQQYYKDLDRFKFEQNLSKNCELKDNQMIIVDDRKLTLSSIDLNIGKAKARFGDNLRVVIVDYLNQIVLEGVGKYDWTSQIEVSTQLKNLARKHEVSIISPYQIDASGEARFSKGILDSPDISIVLEAKEDSIDFKSTKMRGAPEIKFNSPINWETLRLSNLPGIHTDKKEKPADIQD